MKNTLCMIGTFILGAAAGSAVTYVFQRKKYEEEKDIFYENEVGPAREEYITKTKELIEENRQRKIDEFMDISKEEGYVESNPREYVEVLENDFPSVYLISSSEYAESNFYPKKELVYHTNGVLVDEDYNVVDDVDSIISKEVYSTFDDHLKNGEDIVWVRNEDISTDFEVQLADYEYSE